MSDSREIHDATMGCISSFEACLSVKSLMQEGWAESRLADMRLWASGVGALVISEASLDRRLQFRPKPRLVLTSLLLTLQELINNCRMHALYERLGNTVDDSSESKDTPDSPEEDDLESTLRDDSDVTASSVSWFTALKSDQKDESSSSTDPDKEEQPNGEPSEATLKKRMKDTEGILDQLIMLGFAIRKSGTTARLQRADESFRADENKDLRRHLEFIILSAAFKRQKTTEDNRGITAADRMQEAEKDYGEATPEQRHLILANLRRRHRFRYAKRHQQKLDHGVVRALVAVPATENREMPVQEYPYVAIHERESPIEQSRSTILPTPLQEIFQVQEMSVTAASAAEGDILEASKPAQVSASRVSVSVATMNYPSPPPINKQMRGFKCPCCYQTLPEMFHDWSRWRKHVAEDLCPYTCPFPECPRAEVLYISRPAWRDHILAAHGACQYWECLACAGTGMPNTFLSAEEFVSHNRTQHHETISEDQIVDLQHSCRKTAPQNISRCPLCPWPQDELMVPNATANIEHVGNCIHEFSLNALPWAESTDIGTADSSNPVRQKVQGWFTRMEDETKDVDIRQIDVKTFGVLPTRPRPGRQGGAYIREEYFAESSKESSQAERGSIPLDSDPSEMRGTYSDDEQDPQISHDMKDLEEAIQAARRTVEVTPPDHPDLADRIENLGNKLQSRFEQTKRLEDLEEAIRITSPSETQEASAATAMLNVEETDNDSRISIAKQMEYWAQQSLDNNGMTGGYPQVSPVDIQFSRNFLHKLRRLHPASDRNSQSSEQKTEYTFRNCLETGAGIGRVTLGLLCSISEKIDIVEPMEKFTAGLTAPDSPLVKSGQLRRVYNVPLQDWTAEMAPSFHADFALDEQDKLPRETRGRYDLIWNQWCLDHLPNSALVRYFSSLIPLLAPDGWIIVKENISLAEGGVDTFWEQDSRVTRSDASFRACFEQAGLVIVRTQFQTGFPRKLLPVRMYALRPAS